MNLAMIFISHDLSVVKQISNRVAVMYFGKIVEYGATENIFRAPQNEYTKTLLAAIPVTHPKFRNKPQRKTS